MVRDIGPIYAPYFVHLYSYRDQLKSCQNLFSVSYEEMQMDLPKVVNDLIGFLELDPITDDQMNELCDHVSFKKMKENPAVNSELLEVYDNI